MGIFRKKSKKPTTSTSTPLAHARGATTSEFWVTLLIAAGGVLQNLKGSENHYVSVVGAVFALVYVLGRFKLKLQHSAQLSEVDSLKGELDEVYLNLSDTIDEIQSIKQDDSDLRLKPITSTRVEIE